MRRIICVSDWVQDELALEEFRTAVTGFAKNPRDVRFSSVASTSSTMHTGFLMAQLAYTQERLGIPNETLIFQNTDPRIPEQGSNTAAHGSHFVIAQLASGLLVCGPNAGYNFSFLKKSIVAAFTYTHFDTPTVLRSRDVFSRMAAHLADYMEQELELDELHIGTISDEPEGSYVLHVDPFHNIITSITQEQSLEKHQIGNYVRISLKNEVHEVRLVPHRFASVPGDLTLYPGSKGHLDNPYMEIGVWHDTTQTHRSPPTPFEHARPGDELSLQ